MQIIGNAENELDIKNLENYSGYSVCVCVCLYCRWLGMNIFGLFGWNI